MSHMLSPIGIFLPVLAIVALTFVGFIRMAVARTAAVKGGQDPAYYRAHLGPPEPEATVVAVRHWDNLFEFPLLFYTGCVSAYALNAVNGWVLAFAWAFAAARILQSFVHLTSNNTSARGGFFSLGVLFVMALWADLAVAIVSRL